MIPVGLSHLHVVKFLNCRNLTTSYQLSLCLEMCSSHSNSREQRMFFLRPRVKNAFTFQRSSRIWQSKLYLRKLFFFFFFFPFYHVKVTVQVWIVWRDIRFCWDISVSPELMGYVWKYFLAKVVLAENQKLASSWHHWKVHTQSESTMWPLSFCSCGTWGFILHRRIEPFTFLGNWYKMGICDLFPSALSGVCLHDFNRVPRMHNEEALWMETL